MTDWITDDRIVIADFDGKPVRKGNRVAVAVRDGNCAGMRIGTVVTIRHYMAERRAERHPVFKVMVSVEKTSGYYGASGKMKPRNVWFSAELIIRLPSAQPRPHATGAVVPRGGIHENQEMLPFPEFTEAIRQEDEDSSFTEPVL